MFTLTSDFNVCLSDTAINSTESYFIKIVRSKLISLKNSQLCIIIVQIRKFEFGDILSMTVLFHSDNFTLPILKRAQHHSVTYKCRKREECLHLLGSIVVSIPACHAGDPGSIPGRGKKNEKV
ncbi:hypothetical protein T4D_4561 [Trichinella pseudospiralis]|uniref:Uncharacterized protein n=1 Tax=Trichinella pseudospiralis TaxID=6337 RepID=A0A0V1G4W7_TRIPS|nr:hypothetical protein T4D_4561 [Trichinella pseudospiralis]